MQRTIFIILVISVSLIISWPALAQDPIVFPAQGQSEEQMEKDKFQCYTWSRDQTGFDPKARPQATTAPPPQQQPTTSAGRGAVRGGAAGIAVGAISGNARRGARVGAASGAVVGSSRKRSQQKQQQQANQQWAQQEAAKYEQARATYNRAYSACMEGQGYTVK